MASFAEYTKKKKKEKENLSAAGKSFSEYTREKLGIELDDIAPVSVTTIAPTVTTSKKSSYFDDGYDFGDITKTILGLATSAGKTINTVASSPKKNEEATKSTFDKVLEKQYSSMSLTELEKEKSRIEKEEKEHKEKNGGKLTNYLSKAGSYIAEGMSGQSGSSVRTKAQSNIDKIDDLTRQKEILNVYRKQKATEEYLGGLDDKQLKMLDNIAEAKDLENAAPFSILAPQGGMDATTYSKITEVERTAGKEAREQLYNQLKKKNPKKSDEELNELIDNMVELRRNQVNAKENSSMMLDIKGNGAASAFDPTLENKVGFATEHPVASFLLSRGLNVLGGPMGLFEMYMQRGNEYGLDTNAPGFSFTNAASTIDEKIQLDHDWKIGGVDAFDLFYKAGTGIVDNVARLAMSGGNTTLAGAMMFTQGTTQSIIAGKEKGYSDAKALTMGLLDGTFEAISEKISLDSILGNKGGALRTLAKSFAAEGSEELTSNWLNRIADQIANGKHSDLSKQYEAYINEGYTKSQALAEVVGSVIGEDFESFLIGGIAGAVMGSGVAVSNVQQNKTNQLSEDNLSKEAKTVFDKVVEARIAEATEDGKTLTEMEEAKIRQAVLKEISNGDIETEEIESILSPEDYAKYKKVADTSSAYESKLNEGIEKMQQRHDELQKEYDELNELDLMTAKLGDHNRQNDIKKEMASLEEKIQQWNTELDEYKNDKTRSELETNLKTKLEQNVFELVKDTELGESYRRKQAFEADFEKFKGTKHEDAARKTLENAEKSGLRNSKGIRTLVEASARFSGNTGVVFEYKTGEQAKNDFIERQTAEISKIESIPEAQRTKKQIKDLANMKKTLEDVKSGKLKVDGNVTGNTITINLDSPKALNIVTGHEITHLFEKAKSYKKLKDAVIEYAKMKGIDTESELEIREAKYSGAKDSNPEAELVADLVGDFLHTDYDFVLHLANKKTDLFHHLWDEVKYLCKMATAGSKEARQLEKVKRNFERAYRESAKSGAKVEGTQNSLSDAQHSLSSEQEDYFKDSKVRDENGNLKVMYHGTSGGGHTVFDTYGSNYGLMGTGSYFTDNKSVAESYTNKGKGNNKQVYESYLNITNPLDMDAQGNAEEWAKAFPDVDFPESGTNEQFYREVEEFYSDQMMPKWEAAEEIRESIQFGMGYDGITHIGGGRVNADGTKHQVYIAFEPEQIKNIDNIAPTNDADIRYSLTETDNKYLSAVESGDTETAQKMVDEVAKENGYTIKAYHGSRNEFNVFSKDKRGSNTKTEISKRWFFAADKETANSYYPYGVIETLQGKEAAEKLKSKGRLKGKLYDLYIKMDNPLVVDVADYDYAAHRENADAWMEYVSQAEENGNDGIILLNALDNQLKTYARESTVYMFKDSSQAKSADAVTYDDNGNVIPLSQRFNAENPDIRYSLSDTLEKNGNLLYDKNSPLSVDNRAKTNNNSSLKWVYDAEIFSVQESKLFHSKISEINTGRHSFGNNKNTLGEYMIPIGNKIVFTDGNYDSPYVREIVEVLTEYDDEFEKARERIFNVEKGKSEKQDTVRTLEQMFGKGFIVTYRSGNDGVYDWQNGQRKGKTRRTVIKNHLNKQYRGRNDRASQETSINEIAPVKETSSEDGVFFDAEKTKYSLSEDSKGRKLTKEQEDFFKRVSPLLKDENGNIKRYYHGTARGDRVGTYFDPERATSGPMAFFTDNPEIAEGYSKSKADTSMSYDPDYDSYETQFRVNINGNDMSLINAWRYLPMSAKARIKDRAEHTHYDWDDYETLIYDEETTEAGGGFSWQLREARGNVLQALNEQWLNSGNLFNEEGKYIDVLKFIGVHDEFKKLGYGEPYYKDPYYREEKVFEVYLNVTNPFHTADVDEEFLNDARDWVDNTDLSIYESETADSDLWDKRSLDPYEWLDRLEDDIKNGTTHAWTSIPDVITDFLKEYGGYDGIVDAGGKHTGYGHQVVIPFYSEQIKNIDNETPTTDVHIDLSLSEEGDRSFAPADSWLVYGDRAEVPSDFAPVKGAAEESSVVAPTVQGNAPTVNGDDYAPMTEAEANAMYEADRGYINTFTDADMPPEMDAPIYSADTTSIDDKALNNIAKTVKDALSLSVAETKAVKEIIQKYSTSETQSEGDLFEELKANFGEKSWSERNEEIANVKQALRNYKINVSPTIKRDITDYAQFRRRNFGKIIFSKEGIPVDTAYMELSDTYPSLFPASITNATDQLLQMSEVANMEINETQTEMLDDESIQEATELIVDVVNTYKENELLKGAKVQGKEFLKNANKYEEEMPKISNDFAPTKQYETIEPRPDVLSDEEKQWAKNKMARADKANAEEKPRRRSELHQSIVDKLKSKFTEKGFDFDEVLSKAKNLSTPATVDNTPQRVMEKSLGYKQGQILADETVNKVAQNESEGIKWLNSFTDRKNGVLAQISKQYNIKPGSKKSAAAQMYAEGFYVNKNNEIIEYGDRELAIDFPDLKVQENIKGLARDPRIRQIYDDTLNAINESRSRNLYPEIPRLDNYFLHFRAMEDTFSRLGLPFNPNDIRAKDLPTDLNGVTADLKPGQPYFASAMHREGMRTSFDLLGGLERYLSSAKNQIYHIDDIQTLRALRNYIADTYGQAKGLESLDDLSDEEAQYRIEQVYNSHLSTFAKFLNEEANVLAGKTTLIDRGLEGVFGRRAFTFFDTLNKQVGSNMVGWNISSSLTNFLPVAQTFAKTNKFDFTKAFAQTVSSKIGSIFGKTDSFVENNPTIIRRKGAERFYRTPYQKIGDTGYVLMSAVDDISTELIVRTKYNELIRKGMDEQKASFEADKWVSRLMGDRSLGQQPQLYNSKGLGLLTKFQLEVRNQLDSQFYDTIQEAKVSNEEIENKLLKNAKTAAKVTSVFFQLAAVQHLYGMAFESIAGYNPAFDIIDVLIKALGFDDDEEDEDTPLDNFGEAIFALAEDLPYTGIVTGGRIPFSSALPSWESTKQLFTGEDVYGNKISRKKTLAGILDDVAPYYVLPTGFGQLKKTAKGLKMFSDDHPVAGSYTDSGNLRFPVEDNLKNRIQAGVFGQYANENARTYFDEDYAPLKENQIKEYAEAEMPIADYWKYREGLKDFTKQDEKAAYINGLDISKKQKDVLKSYLYDEEGYKKENPEKYAFLEREGIGYLGYKELDEDTQSAWSWAFKHQDEYEHFKENGVLPGDYSTYYIPMLEFEDEGDEAYQWSFDNPEKATLGRVFGNGVKEYRQYAAELNEIKADKDSNGKTISGSAKEKKKAYIWSLPIDYGQKVILYRSLYDSKDDKATYNQDIIDYLISREDITYDEMNTICEELGFEVNRETSRISW